MSNFDHYLENVFKLILEINKSGQRSFIKLHRNTCVIYSANHNLLFFNSL